jgi:hypothetical protein
LPRLNGSKLYITPIQKHGHAALAENVDLLVGFEVEALDDGVGVHVLRCWSVGEAILEEYWLGGDVPLREVQDEVKGVQSWIGKMF